MVGITTSTGLGSGLDITGIVNQLVSAEITPKANRLDQKEVRLQAQISAVGTLKGSMSNFQSSLSALRGQLNFDGRSAISSNTSVADVTTTETAASGNYNLSVTQLADAHSLVTDSSLTAAQFTSETDVLGTGTLTFKFGTTAYDPVTDTYTSFTQNADKGSQSITITDGSLVGIRDAINNAGMGVTASIINDGTHYRLAITSTTGEASSMEITVADDDGNNTDASGLSLLDFSSSATNLSQTHAGQDALLSINGVSVTNASNTLTSTISGLNVTLNSAGTSTITVSQDTSSAKSAINGFVKAYNGLVSTMNKLSAYDPATKVGGPLQGDVTLLSIRSQLNTILASAVDGLPSDAPYRILADVGITRSSSDGTMTIDSAKLDAALQNNPKDVANLFGDQGNATDSQVSYVESLSDTPVGNYAVDVTSLATQGTFVGSAAAALTITSGVNDTLDISLGGVAGGITLTPGTYTAATLAAEIQAAINGIQTYSNAGLSVTVSENAGVLTLTSNRYGSSSAVSVTGGTGQTDLFGSSPVATDGTDIVGSIGSAAGTGSGQELTGDAGALGLKIKVTGSATGSRGSITLTRGIGVQLDALMASMLDTNGMLNDKTNSINSSIDDINAQRDQLLVRQTALHDRLQKQFIALDTLVGQLTATSNSLASQLASLPKIGG
ncbi:MAG: flagellar filament capping protein FliD [Gammaproteobacteria bacterium]|nr:flagellar filament capping protein FliD [Gammaproteobacteria bacterium]